MGDAVGAAYPDDASVGDLEVRLLADGLSWADLVVVRTAGQEPETPVGGRVEADDGPEEILVHDTYQVTRLVVVDDERTGAQGDTASGDLRDEAHDRQMGDKGGDPIHLLTVNHGLSDDARGQLSSSATDLRNDDTGILTLTQGAGDRVEQQQVGVNHLLGAGCR